MQGVIGWYRIIDLQSNPRDIGKSPAAPQVTPAGADRGFTKPDGGPHDAVNQQALDKAFAFLEGLFPKPR